MITTRQDYPAFRLEEVGLNPVIHCQLNWCAIRRVWHKHDLARRERKRRIRFFLEGISRSKA